MREVPVAMMSEQGQSAVQPEIDCDWRNRFSAAVLLRLKGFYGHRLINSNQLSVRLGFAYQMTTFNFIMAIKRFSQLANSGFILCLYRLNFCINIIIKWMFIVKLSHLSNNKLNMFSLIVGGEHLICDWAVNIMVQMPQEVI